MTAEASAEVLGLGENSICVEMGLVEEAKSFRGKALPEPRPNWDPLILPLSELKIYSSRLNMEYVSLMDVKHVRDEAALNTVREVHSHIEARDEITKDRCRQAILKIVNHDFPDEAILCVGHGATVGGCHKTLEEGLPDESKVTGDKAVSCFAEFRPVDPANRSGPWKSVEKLWRSGDIFGGSNSEP